MCVHECVWGGHCVKESLTDPSYLMISVPGSWLLDCVVLSIHSRLRENQPSSGTETTFTLWIKWHHNTRVDIARHCGTKELLCHSTEIKQGRVFRQFPRSVFTFYQRFHSGSDHKLNFKAQKQQTGTFRKKGIH